MTDKEFHRDAFIVCAIIIIALLLWYWLTNSSPAAQAAAATPPSPISQAPSYTFNVPGSVSNYGPVVFPSSVYNYPALNSPTSVTPGNVPIASAVAANCSCGCDGSGGTTTYVLQPPDFSSVFNQLLTSAADTAQALINAEYASLGYSEGVFVANATPTAFSGGEFPSYG